MLELSQFVPCPGTKVKLCMPTMCGADWMLGPCW